MALVNGKKLTKEYLSLFLWSASQLLAVLPEDSATIKLKHRIETIFSLWVQRVSISGSGPLDRNALEKLLGNIEALFDGLEFIRLFYKPTPILFLSLIRSSLFLKLLLLRKAHVPVSKNRRELFRKQTNTQSSSKTAIELDEHAQKERAQKHQQEIFQFIQMSPSIRTRDIIRHFPDLSERTIKRRLKELVAGGLVKRYISNHAVFYSPSP